MNLKGAWKNILVGKPSSNASATLSDSYTSSY